MNKYFAPLLGLALILGAAGCSSNEGGTDIKESSAAESSVVSEENPGTPVEAGEGAAFKEELEKAGSSILDVKKDGDTETFMAENENGTYQVAITELSDASQASSTFTENASQLQTDSYEEVNSLSADGKEIRLMLNDYNSVFAIVAADENAGTVIVCQDIPEAARDGVVDLFHTLGYPTENLTAAE